MEDALVRRLVRRVINLKMGLNPCFNGRCTRTDFEDDLDDWQREVLILVLMEDALVLSQQ